MDLNILEFISNLTIIEMYILIAVIEVIETASGIINAASKGKSIRSAITLQSIAKKFNTWKWVFALSIFAIFTGNDEVAKLILVFVLIPEVTSIIENIVRTFTEKRGN